MPHGWEILLTSQVEAFRPAPSTGRSEVRILFVFDPWRSAVLLIAGGKAGRWNEWYRKAVPQAERLYEMYVREREREIES